MTYRIAKAGYYKNPFIGLYIRTNDRHTLMAKNAPEKIHSAVKNALGTETVELFINQSPLVGLFCVLNSNGCILAADAEKAEKSAIKKLGYNVHALKSSLTPGNSILVNDKSCLASPQLPRLEAKEVADCLGVEVFQHKLSGISTIGATNVATNNGLLAYNDVTDVEFKHMLKIMQVPGGSNGTTNNGVVYNSFGLVANSRGALVGELTTGFETQRVYEALSGE